MSLHSSNSRNRLETALIILVIFVLGGIVIFTAKGSGNNTPSLAHGVQNPISVTASAAYPIHGVPSAAYPILGIPAATAIIPELYPPPVTTIAPEDPSAPFHVMVNSEPGGLDQDTLTQVSSLIIYGTVTEVQPARWSTPDGARPKNPFSADNTAFIYTPVRISITQQLKGKPQNEVLIYVSGGVVGQDIVEVERVEQYSFSIGQRVLLYLPKSTPSLNGVIFNFYDRYTITSDDQARNEVQQIPLQQLLDSIRLSLSKQ